jgi:hypothetical protein
VLEIRKNQFGGGRSIHERNQRKRTAGRVIVAAAILLVLSIAGAVVYVWYMGRHPLPQAVQTVDTRSAAPTVKTYTPSPDAPVGIVLQTFTGSTAAGSNAALSIKTNPGAACQISVKVNNASLPDSGLVPKIADEFGIVDWSWNVPKNVLPGKWPVEVACANEAKKSAQYKVELEVTR